MDVNIFNDSTAMELRKAVDSLRAAGMRSLVMDLRGNPGGVLAQFDLAATSFDLINADYVIGIPLTFRRGGFSGRARFYHLTSAGRRQLRHEEADFELLLEAVLRVLQPV